MHSSLVLLALVSIILIAFMVGCFICFIRSRRIEDVELMEQAQYNNMQQYNEQMHRQQLLTPQRQKQLSQSPSANDIMNDHSSQQQQQQYPNRPTFQVPVGTSPYHTSQAGLSPQDGSRTETRSDITQQINSAIIGSTEAEFQNDFIQVSLALGLSR